MREQTNHVLDEREHLPIVGELGKAEAGGGGGDEEAVVDCQHHQNLSKGHLK